MTESTGSTLDPDRLAARVDAAQHATFASSQGLREVIAREAAALNDQWQRGTRSAAELEAQCRALRAVADTYDKLLKEFWASFPQGIPPEPSGEAHYDRSVLMRGANGMWGLKPETLDYLESQLQLAQACGAEARRRPLTSGHRKAAQEASTSLLLALRALYALATQITTEHERCLSERAEEARALRSAADIVLGESVQAVAEATRRLPPASTPWNHPAWKSWAPRFDHDNLFAGSLRLRQGQVEGLNADWASAVDTPLFIPVRQPVRLRHTRAERETALALGRSILLRALASTLPGELQLTIFDPTGLGQSTGSLLDLADYNNDLIGGKVWSSTEDLERVLAEHTRHIELVIQKYLRAEYATLADFNAAAGEVAEPLRLLAIFDAPTGFDERALGELRRIIENGPRCGVATLLLSDSDLAPAHGVDLDQLPTNLWTINLAAPFRGPDGREDVVFDFVPDLDSYAPDEILKALIQVVGMAATERTSTAVSFEKVFGLFSRTGRENRGRDSHVLRQAVDAADRETWWGESTLEGIAGPVGQRGARDAATLRFDSSDHSGALLVGRQGSGKSTLLHTYIAGIATLYGPEELELHLIDFKEGVEFKVYAANGLPHARTVAIESDREFGVSVLQALQAELAWRGSLLRGSDSHSSLETLRRATGERLPRILLVFDEFQVLFNRTDKLGATAAEALEALIRQGRGFGIHVLLGSQSLAGLDALGSHVPQLLPVRILLPASDEDASKVLGERNTEGTALLKAGDGILNAAGGAVEANERFRGAVIDEQARVARVVAMRAMADERGFNRRPVVFEGNSPIPAEDTPPEQFADEMRGADSRTLRLRLGAPMAISGSADINLRREAGGNILLVARENPLRFDGVGAYVLPRAVISNLVASAAAQRAQIEVADFLPAEEGIADHLAPLVERNAVAIHRRRDVPALLERINLELDRRLSADSMNERVVLLTLYGMHRARDFDPDSVDYDSESTLSDTLARIVRDGPEFGIHTLLWFETAAGINRRLSGGVARELAWRLAGRMSTEDAESLTGSDAASTLREQQLMIANEDRGILTRCTTIAEPTAAWHEELMDHVQRLTP